MVLLRPQNLGFLPYFITLTLLFHNMQGSAITIKRGKLKVPNDPIIPFIEGDGIGPDIWAASVRVLDAAVEKAFKGKKKSFGKKYWPVKKHLIIPAPGFRMKLSM